MNVVKDSILLGYITGNSIDRVFMPTVFGFMNYDANNRRCLIGLGEEPGYWVDDNRNALARKFLQTPAEYLLSLDTDISIEPTAPYIMLDTMKQRNIPILSAWYVSIFEGQVKPCWYMENPKGGVDSISSFKVGEVMPIDACGMGCWMAHRSVFEKFLEVPEYAADSWTWFGRDVTTVNGKPAHESEDISFCLRAKKLGFQIYGHAGVNARHYKRMELGFEEFQILYNANYRGVRG